MPKTTEYFFTAVTTDYERFLPNEMLKSTADVVQCVKEVLLFLNQPSNCLEEETAIHAFKLLQQQLIKLDEKTMVQSLEQIDALFQQKTLQLFMAVLEEDKKKSLKNWLKKNNSLFELLSKEIVSLKKYTENFYENFSKTVRDNEKQFMPAVLLNAKEEYLNKLTMAASKQNIKNSKKFQQLNNVMLLFKTLTLDFPKTTVDTNKIVQHLQSLKMLELLEKNCEGINKTHLLLQDLALSVKLNVSLSIEKWLIKQEYQTLVNEAIFYSKNNTTTCIELLLNTIKELPLPDAKLILVPITQEAAIKIYKQAIDDCFNKENYKQALGLVKIARAIFKKIEKTEENKEELIMSLGICKSTIASCYEKLNIYDKATNNCVKAFGLFSSIKASENEAHTLDKLPKCLSKNVRDIEDLRQQAEEYKSKGLTKLAAVFFQRVQLLEKVAPTSKEKEDTLSQILQ